MAVTLDGHPAALQGAGKDEDVLQRIDRLPNRHVGCRSADDDGVFALKSANQLSAHAAERLGFEVQALTFLRAGRGEDHPLCVWEALTPYGFFWVVEDGEVVEIFSASSPRGVNRRTGASVRLAKAMARFRELHAACTGAHLGAPTAGAQAATD